MIFLFCYSNLYADNVELIYYSHSLFIKCICSFFAKCAILIVVTWWVAHLCPVNKLPCVQGSIYSLFLYDAVYLYMTMMEQIVSEKLDWRNGTFWRQRARNWVTNGQWGDFTGHLLLIIFLVVLLTACRLQFTDQSVPSINHLVSQSINRSINQPNKQNKQSTNQWWNTNYVENGESEALGAVARWLVIGEVVSFQVTLIAVE